MSAQLPNASSRPPALLLAIAVAAVECVGLIAYGISIVVAAAQSGSSGTQGSDVSPAVLLLIFIMFGGLIGLVVRSLWRGNGSARTAYLVTQGFALVIAQTLIAGSELFERVVGWSLVVGAIAGAVCILTPAEIGRAHV